MISRMAGLGERLVSPKFTRRQANSEVVSAAAAWVLPELPHSSSHDPGWLSLLTRSSHAQIDGILPELLLMFRQPAKAKLHACLVGSCDFSVFNSITIRRPSFRCSRLGGMRSLAFPISRQIFSCRNACGVFLPTWLFDHFIIDDHLSCDTRGRAVECRAGSLDCVACGRVQSDKWVITPSDSRQHDALINELARS